MMKFFCEYKKMGVFFSFCTIFWLGASCLVIVKMYKI